MGENRRLKANFWSDGTPCDPSGKWQCPLWHVMSGEMQTGRLAQRMGHTVGPCDPILQDVLCAPSVHPTVFPFFSSTKKQNCHNFYSHTTTPQQLHPLRSCVFLSLSLWLWSWDHRLPTKWSLCLKIHVSRKTMPWMRVSKLPALPTPTKSPAMCVSRHWLLCTAGLQAMDALPQTPWPVRPRLAALV